MHGMTYQNSAYNSVFLRSLQERGALHQLTDAAALNQAAQSGIITAHSASVK
jgi:hypothetical protein